MKCMSMGKHHKVPFQPSVTAYKQPLTLAHADLWGHAPCLTPAYFKYYICFVDHATRYLWLYTLPTKSETLPCFIKFKKLVELQLRFLLNACKWTVEVNP